MAAGSGSDPGALDRKVNEHFAGVVVRKDLVKAVKGNAIVLLVGGVWCIRDRDGVHKTFSGLMKILYPHDEATRAEDGPEKLQKQLEYLLQIKRSAAVLGIVLDVEFVEPQLSTTARSRPTRTGRSYSAAALTSSSE